MYSLFILCKAYSQSKLHSAERTFILNNSCLVSIHAINTCPWWAVISWAKQTKLQFKNQSALQKYIVILFYFLQIKLQITRRILSTTFTPCSHGEFRFLRSKKTRIENKLNPIDSRTRNRTRFQRIRNQTAPTTFAVRFPENNCTP